MWAHHRQLIISSSATQASVLLKRDGGNAPWAEDEAGGGRIEESKSDASGRRAARVHAPVDEGRRHIDGHPDGRRAVRTRPVHLGRPELTIVLPAIKRVREHARVGEMLPAAHVVRRPTKARVKGLDGRHRRPCGRRCARRRLRRVWWCW